MFEEDYGEERSEDIDYSWIADLSFEDYTRFMGCVRQMYEPAPVVEDEEPPF